MVWTILRSLFPFLKETIIGKGSFAQALKYDRRRLYVFVMVMTSLFLNLILIPDYITLKFSKDEIDVRAMVDVNRRLAQQVTSLKQELAFCYAGKGEDLTEPSPKKVEPETDSYDRHNFLFNELNQLAGPTYHSNY